MSCLQVSERWPPGARVVIRDAEWLVRQVDPTSNGLAIDIVGLSELVRNKEARVLADAEEHIEVLDLGLTRLGDVSGASIGIEESYHHRFLNTEKNTDRVHNLSISLPNKPPALVL